MWIKYLWQTCQIKILSIQKYFILWQTRAKLNQTSDYVKYDIYDNCVKSKHQLIRVLYLWQTCQIKPVIIKNIIFVAIQNIDCKI